MSQTHAARHRIGSLLVALQFTLIAVLAWLAAPSFLGWAAPPTAWFLLLLSAALGLWALLANRPGNFNIRPAPREGGKLVRHGPYRWIRHPMYTSVGVFAAGCAVAEGSLAAVAAGGMLGAVLVAKASMEEQWMAEHHPAYADYRARTWRFVPGVF